MHAAPLEGPLNGLLNLLCAAGLEINFSLAFEAGRGLLIQKILQQRAPRGEAVISEAGLHLDLLLFHPSACSIDLVFDTGLELLAAILIHLQNVQHGEDLRPTVTCAAAAGAGS